MSKITPFLEEVVYLVADFLASLEHTKQAQKLRKQFQLPQWTKKDNPLIKKGLKKVLKQYINSNEKVLKYYKNRKPESQEQEESEEEQPTPKPQKKQRKSVSPVQSPMTRARSPKISTLPVHQPTATKGWMASQFQQPKRLEDLNDNDSQPAKIQQPEVDIPKKDKKDKKAKKQVKKQQSSEQQSESEQVPKPKKQKKEIKKQKKTKKVKGPVDSSYLNSEEEFELDDQKQKKSAIPQKKVEKKIQPVKKVEPKVETDNNQTDNYYQQNQQRNGDNNFGPKKFFSRINQNEVGHIPENRRDNTFEAKARYGAGDAWGQFGHEKLKDTRGDSFKKTKGKLKNKAFQGSGINMNQINSVPIL